MNVDNDYYIWLLDEVDVLYGEKQNYLLLMRQLYSLEYRWDKKLDANRAKGGKNLRIRFAYDAGVFEESNEQPCTVLEMLIALAIKISDVMGDTSSRWFWEMMTNLNLDVCTDDNFSGEYVNQVINDWMDNKYSRNGVGSPFPISHPEVDCRKLQVWDQCYAYLNENYPLPN